MLIESRNERSMDLIIAEKDKRIAELQLELSKKDAVIAQLLMKLREN